VGSSGFCVEGRRIGIILYYTFAEIDPEIKLLG